MQLKKGTLMELGSPQFDKDIVCFGAGMLPLYAEWLLWDMGIWSKILCFLDNDESKSGRYIGTVEKKKIKTVTEFRQEQTGDFILLIMCEAFESVLRQMDAVKDWRQIECFLYPVLNLSYFKSRQKAGIQKICGACEKKNGCGKQPAAGRQKLPRLIHYCWFGNNRTGAVQELCIDSWKRFCPDYEIVRWDESNYDVTKNTYMREAYEAGKWAFASDYARLDILYRHGGIYLDTDVELIGEIDWLLYYDAFISYGEWPAVNSGAGIGCKKGNGLIREMRDDPRGRIPFRIADGEYNVTTNSVYESKILRKHGLLQDFSLQCLEGMLVLPPDYFAAVSILGKEAYRSENTVGIHHCGGSWADDRRRREMRMTRARGERINGWLEEKPGI